MRQDIALQGSIRPEECVTRALIERLALKCPERVFALFEDGTTLTYLDLHRDVATVAANLHALGVREADFVLSWLGNGREALIVWLGLNYLGATVVPINTAYRGAVLEHVVANSGAHLMIAEAHLLERLAGLSTGQLDHVVVVGANASPLHLQSSPYSLLTGDAHAPCPKPSVAPWDISAVIYTSGTTGPSKGVCCTYAQLYSAVTALPIRGPDERDLSVLPMFHIGGLGPPYGALVHEGSIVILSGFSTSSFWADVRKFGVTTTTLLGAMTSFLMKEPPSPIDREHCLKNVVMVPLTDDSPGFSGRFGIDVFTAFNMTETSMPIVSQANPVAKGTCGRARAGFTLMLADENDYEVPPGQTGELLIRSTSPWTLSPGYNNEPAASLRAWRNGWFHTGDVFRRDADGNFFFVDRKKDAIRRRGENVSSFEVERELCAHPAIREAAVIGVPSEHSEDEILAVLSPVPGANIDFVEIVGFLKLRLAHFMIPRYFRIAADLPKTPTHKIQKQVLRAEGLTASVWDREKAGITLKRAR